MYALTLLHYAPVKMAAVAVALPVSQKETEFDWQFAVERWVICLQLESAVHWHIIDRSGYMIMLKVFDGDYQYEMRWDWMQLVHSKTPHVVTVLWLDSDWVLTILSPTSSTSGRLQNRVSVPP